MCRTNWSQTWPRLSTKSSSKKVVPCCNPFAAIDLPSCSIHTSCCNDRNRHPNLIIICTFMSLELVYKCLVSYRSLASGMLTRLPRTGVWSLEVYLLFSRWFVVCGYTSAFRRVKGGSYNVPMHILIHIMFPEMVVPPKHSKMIMFSRKANGYWVPPL